MSTHNLDRFGRECTQERRHNNNKSNNNNTQCAERAGRPAGRMGDGYGEGGRGTNLYWIVNLSSLWTYSHFLTVNRMGTIIVQYCTIHVLYEDTSSLCPTLSTGNYKKSYNKSI